MVEKKGDKMQLVYDLNLNDWQQYAENNGWKPYRGKQIFSWLYRKRVTSFAAMSDLSEAVRTQLEEDFYFTALECVKRQVSNDGTRKYLFKLTDGSLIETVLMRYDYGNTVCVTTQIGCNMGCTFCASGLLKKTRNLTSGEIVSQVLVIDNELAQEQARVSNIVVMGIGEPFDNYDHVMRFMRTINNDHGMAIGARHITVSTCGVVRRIKQFADEHTQFNLAISLHAPNDTLRSQIMPINRSDNLQRLMEALRYYAAENNRRITFEYILLKGVNDSLEHVLQLKQLIKGMNAYINLIPYNEVDENGYQSVDYKNAMRFYDELTKQGVHCTLRQKQGEDIDAACGQLRANYERA